MLDDYIKEYVVAQNNNDIKAMRKIEANLARLGMDRMTLKILADETRKEQQNENLL